MEQLEPNGNRTINCRARKSFVGRLINSTRCHLNARFILFVVNIYFLSKLVDEINCIRVASVTEMFASEVGSSPEKFQEQSPRKGMRTNSNRQSLL